MTRDSPLYKLQLLVPGDTDRFVALWPSMRSLFAKACLGNMVSAADMTPESIYEQFMFRGELGVFVSTFGGQTVTVLAFRFTQTNNTKGVEFVALAGKDLLYHRKLFWGKIKKWLKRQDVRYIECYASGRKAAAYKRLFGFSRECRYIQGNL